MKTYDELTDAQKDKARRRAIERLLNHILEGGLRFDDKANGDDLQARVDAAIAEANRMQTPWFAHEYILDTCRADLEAMAVCDAEDALYPEDGEYVIYGVASMEDEA